MPAASWAVPFVHWRNAIGRFSAPISAGSHAFRVLKSGGARGLRFSKVVSYGNALDLNEADFLDYFAEDPDTEIIAAYKKAMAAGLYDEVLTYTGKKARAYAATNEKEYFAEGTEASTAYLEAIHPDTKPGRKEQIRQELLEYCAHDTLAMVLLAEYFSQH